MIDIAAIKARADKATAGPWDWNSRHGLGAPNRLVMWPSHEYGCDLDIEGEEADLDFIAHARTDITGLLAAIEASDAARVKAEQALWELDAVGCDFGYYEQAAKTMKSIVDKAIDGLLKQPSILTSTEQKAQGKRCSCGGADDYCVCQNSPDKTTISKRITAIEQERDALKEALTNSCDLLESYIDTFGDMSGANRADLNDYRRALESKP